MSETTAPYGSGPAKSSAASSSPGVKRVRIHHLREMKERGEKFAMLTAYEQYAAQTFDEAGIPVLLVGDSASNNVLGNETSLPVTVDEPSPARSLVPSVRSRGKNAHSTPVFPTCLQKFHFPFGARRALSASQQTTQT